MLEKQTKIFIKNLLVGPAVIVLATVMGFGFKYTNIPETNIAIVYLMAVVASSIFTQKYVISIFYSITATLMFNYFFTEPYFAFEIASVSYIITFVVMVAVSLIITMLAQRIKTNAQIATMRAEENSRLYTITNEITSASTVGDVMRICAKNISERCNAEVIFIYRNTLLSETDYVQHKFVHGKEDTSFPSQMAGVPCFDNAVKVYQIQSSLRYWESVSGTTITSLLCMPRTQAVNLSVSLQRILLIAMENATLASERIIAAEKQAQLVQENERERYRSNLLRAISHDLRTPLSGIMGTSEMIMGMTDYADPRYELAREIMDDADWLHSLMENILNLTRLEDNRHYINKQPEAIEEIIAVVLERFEKRAPNRELQVNIPDDLILVPVDAKLIVQVLINLLDNAVKHTTPQQEISLSVEKQEAFVKFIVTDRGTGISVKDLPHIFQMYYTTAHSPADAQKGMGLGLAICDAVVKAHGGSITAANHPEGGAVFTFTLPMEAVADE